MARPVSAAQRRHWERVRTLGCFVSGATRYVTIHHCSGGSMNDTFGALAPGAGERANHWLVIPLAAEYHTGDWGIDNGMGFCKGTRDWEKTFGTQVEHLDRVCLALGLNVYKLAGLDRSVGGVL